MCVCVCASLCVCSTGRSEPNLTADLARASGAREKALLTTNSLSVCLSHIHTLAESVSLCEYVISKHVLLARRAREVARERERAIEEGKKRKRQRLGQSERRTTQQFTLILSKANRKHTLLLHLCYPLSSPALATPLYLNSCRCSSLYFPNALE